METLNPKPHDPSFKGGDLRLHGRPRDAEAELGGRGSSEAFSLLPSKDKAALQGNSEEQFRSLGIRFRVFESSSKKGFGLRGL